MGFARGVFVTNGATASSLVIILIHLLLSQSCLEEMEDTEDMTSYLRPLLLGVYFH